MLKRDGFQPSDSALFNSALSSVSAALSRQARTAAAGSTFVRAKRRESLLAHTTLPVPETQKRDLTVTPGSSSGLFDSELLAEVVSQVQSSSQISSNLALSRSLRRGRSAPASSSSPLTGPRLPSFAHGRPSGKCSSSSSRSGSRKRFRGGKGGGGGSFFRAFGFPEVGAITFPDPLLVAKGAVELASLPSPGFYSRLFVVWKTSGSWRPVIDFSHLNRFVDVSPFQMETIQSVLLSVRQGDWMASIDLKEAYLQAPVHPASRHFLRFVFRDRVYQFKALCFGLSTALQVFTRVMASVSAILHSMGIRMRRYLDDWLVQFSTFVTSWGLWSILRNPT